MAVRTYRCASVDPICYQNHDVIRHMTGDVKQGDENDAAEETIRRIGYLSR